MESIRRAMETSEASIARSEVEARCMRLKSRPFVTIFLKKLDKSLLIISYKSALCASKAQPEDWRKCYTISEESLR